MTLTVLLTLDGSDKDERALAVAAAFVELADGNARVLRVFDAVHESRTDTENSVRDAAARLRAQVHRDVAWEAVEGADVAATLLQHIEQHDANIVVMATRAAGAVGRALHGSVADRLVRESLRPVVLVPPRAQHLRDKHLQLRRVLVPLDGSRPALRVIPHLLALPRAGDLEYVLIQAVHPERTGGHIVPPGITVTARSGASAEGSEWLHVKAEVAEQRLDDVAERLRGRGGSAEVHVVESTDPGAAIVDAIRNDLVEMIAMTTRGAGGLRRMALGSVAEYVVRHSEIPVLLVTARAMAPP